MKSTIHTSTILKNSLLALLIAMFAVSFTSCEKDDTSEFVGIARVTSLYASSDINITYNFSVLYRVMNDTALLHNDTAIIDSALVTRIAEDGGRFRYLVDYGVQTLAHDGRIKSGKIQVFSYPDSIPGGDWAYATLQNYVIDGVHYTGAMQYIRTGEVIGGQPQFTFVVSINCEYAEGEVFMVSTKELLQTAGVADPLKFDLLRFDVMFTTRGIFSGNAASDIVAANFITETQNPWPISFGCAKIVGPAEGTIAVTTDGKTEILIESLIDTDLDRCADKVMLINDKNFGFPFYI